MQIPAPLRRIGWPVWLTALLLVGGLIETAVNDYAEGHRPEVALVTVALSLPFLMARRAPVVTTAAVMGVVVIAAAALPTDVFENLIFGFLAFIAASYVAGTASEWRLAVAGLAFAAGGAAAVSLIIGNPTDMISTALVSAGIWTAAFLISRRTAQTRELRERTVLLERERDAEARAAVAEERTRIAREMHDVVAHSLSVMVVQAEAAEEMIGIDPERARKPLAAVQDTGRTALTELRRMLGVLRETDDGPDLAPQPGLAGLPALAQQVRDAGLPVTVRVEGEPRPLSPTGDLQAYRIIQEGLTNALKHAGPARAQVVLRWEPRELVVEVTDDGRGYDPATDGGGHGLVGMRERVAVCGGEMIAGRRAEGGFGIVARLPAERVPSS